MLRLREQAAEADLAAFCFSHGLACEPHAKITLGPYSEAVAGLFLRHFGGRNGTLINPEFRGPPNSIKEAFWQAGYGFCRLDGRPRNPEDYYADMLRTLGWTGAEAQMPAWLEESSSTANARGTRWLDSDWEADVERLFTHSFASAAFPGARTKFGAMFGWINVVPPRQLTEEPDWLALHHQAAGHACNQVIIAGIAFSMTEEFAKFASDLCRDYEHACGGWLTPDYSADEFPAYRRRVEQHGLKVGERHKPLFMESIYPMEVVNSDLSRVATHPAPLERLAARTARSQPEFSPPSIYVIAENSD